jgi:hypothetical protein
MIRRAVSICSTYQLLAVEFDEIRRFDRANNYPLSLINVHIEMGLSKYLTKKAETTSPSPPTKATRTTTTSEQ